MPDPTADDFARTPIPAVFRWDDRPRRLSFEWNGIYGQRVEINDVDGKAVGSFEMPVAVLRALSNETIRAVDMLELFQLACAGQGPVERPAETEVIDRLMTAVGKAAANPDEGPHPDELNAVYEAAQDLLTVFHG